MPKREPYEALVKKLDYRKTPMGELVLQRRRIAALNDAETCEVKLNGDYLMSSPLARGTA
ncbi:MAG: hypothetical protein R6V03_08785 [Kiritimatiellia bacterium]